MSDYLENNEEQEARNGVYDKKKLSVLVKKLIGDMTHDEFCSARKVGRTTLSAILNCKLDSPPTINTLSRISGHDKNLTRELCYICGYPEKNIDQIDKMTQMKNKKFMSFMFPEFIMDSLLVASFVIQLLMLRGFGKKFRVDYTEYGTFVIDSVNGYKLHGISAYASNNQTIDEVYGNVIRNLLLVIHNRISTILQLNPGNKSNIDIHDPINTELQQKSYSTEKTVICIFTNSRVLFDRILETASLISSSPLRISVLLSIDGVDIVDQKEAYAFTGINNLAIDEFPINLLSTPKD